MNNNNNINSFYLHKNKLVWFTANNAVLHVRLSKCEHGNME